MLDTAIYLGPSLARTEAASILDATYLPPICRGDLAKLPQTVRTVGIIDGEFYQSLAVSPKEVIALLERGVRVLGASSMGALRAAETHAYGMIGVGRIFSMYRDGILDADDEVALIYEPHTYRKLSEPLVNLRCAVELAQREGIIDAHEAERLISEVKATYFPRRSRQLLQQLCPAMTSFLQRTPVPDLKRDDAIDLLLAIKTSRFSSSPEGV